MPTLLLVALIAVGAVAMGLIYATLPDKYDREMEWFEVTNGEVQIRRSPQASAGVTHYLMGGTFHPVRNGHQQGWVYVIVHDGCSGWVEAEAIETSTQRTPGR